MCTSLDLPQVHSTHHSPAARETNLRESTRTTGRRESTTNTGRRESTTNTGRRESTTNTGRRESTTNTGRRESMINTTFDLPPPYSSLNLPANERATEDAPPRYESEDETGNLLDIYFEEKTTRIAFIQKVLALKLLQVLIICAVMAIFSANTSHRDINRLVKNGYVYLVTLSTLAFLLIYCLMVAKDDARRKFPAQYIFLVGYPILLSIFISVWSSYCDVLAPIFLAYVYYCVVTLVLLQYSIFAFQTNLDFVTKYGIPLAIGTQIVLYAFTMPFLNMNAGGVLCATFLMICEYIYVICHLEVMTTTQYWRVIRPAEYVFAALNLHVDYFNILYNRTYFKIPQLRRFVRNLHGIDEAEV